MEKRSQEILKAVIREHIKSAQPVGSEAIVSKYKLGVSSATVRNELAALEEEGFLVQPHTSAGRIPTAKGYLVWVDEVILIKNHKAFPDLGELLVDKTEDGFKLLAKELSKLSNASVFWAPHRRSFYHTALSNLLTQPEFVGSNLIYDISGVVDRMEDVIRDNYDQWREGVEVVIGEANPFSSICGAIVLKYRFGGFFGVIGLLAPLRQDYEKNIALMKYLENKLQS
jgi:transcriptional regulator of heat shock response